ncbi:hypothetical protein WS52_30670 [Burkholderia territorii]|nr:hypothetical protein WS52_30670 [Burkholderia territorii]KWA07986.1 hypothetical protein WT36_12745 [Burkholderia territorii]
MNCTYSYSALVPAFDRLAVAARELRQEPRHVTTFRRDAMLGTILIIVLILLLIGAFPAWPHSRSWGYWPSGSVGLIVVIVVILVLMGRI